MKKHFLFSVLALSLIGCKRSSDDVIPQVETSILPIKTTEDDGDMTTFKYNGDKISESNYIDGKSVFTYDGDNIIKSTNYKLDGTLVGVVTYTYTNDKLVSSVESNGNNTYTTIYKWIDDNHVQSLSSSSPNQTIDIYFNNGNLVKIITSNQNSIITKTYESDANNNPYKNIRGVKKIAFDDDSTFGTNNLLKISTVTKDNNNNIIYNSTSNISYVYNGNKYPTKATTISNSGTNTYTSVKTFEYNR